MHEKHYLINEFAAFMAKTWIWIVTIMGGIVAKVSLDVLNGKRMSFTQRLAVIGISFFGGYLTAVYCESNNMSEQGKWMVPLATLFSETIIMWVVNNHKRIFFQILGVFTNKNQQNNDNDLPPVV
jgi:hypothetical protein